MAIFTYSDDESTQWDQYVMNSDNATCYHLSGWKRVIEKSFGHRTFYLLSKQNSSGQLSGILPLVNLRSRLFGNFLVSLPYFNYGGLCCDDDKAGADLLMEASSIAKRENAKHIEFRHVKNNTYGLPVKTAKVSMLLDLPANEKDLWDKFPSKLRSQIRKPEKEDLYAKIGGKEELESFYAVFAQNMRDLGTPVYSINFFRNILAEFPSSTWICTVYSKEGQPVASGFLIGFKDRMEIPWASSLREYNHMSPNMLLYWSALQFACAQGYRVFDFGRSTPGEGTYKFKEQWGAKPIQLYWHYWLGQEGKLPELNPKNPQYAMAINIWRKLPVSLTKIIGPRIVKNLP